MEVAHEARQQADAAASSRIARGWQGDVRDVLGRSPSWWRHHLFQLGMVVKGLDGVLEIAGGVLLAVLGSTGVGRTVAFLTQHELSEDPRDPLARWAVDRFGHLAAGTVLFAVAYLLVHGAVKVVLTAGLIRGRLGVFPWALGFLGTFVLYQGYRLTVQPSAGLAALTVLDLVIMVLVWREYEALRTTV